MRNTVIKIYQRYFVSWALFFTLLVTLTLTASAQSMTVNGVFDYNKAKDLVNRMNKVRKINNLPLLTMESSLTEAAMLRAAELSTQWNFNMGLRGPILYHQRPNGSQFYTIVGEKYAPKQFDTEVLGEVLVCGVASDLWKASQRKAIVTDKKTRGKWTTVGAGVCYSNGLIFWVVLYTKTGNGKTDIPDGLWDVQVQVDTLSGGHTKLLSQVATDSTHLSQSVEIEGTYLYDMAGEIATLVNKDRRTENLPLLIIDSVLTHYAMLRAAELATGTSVISTITQKYGADAYDGNTTEREIFDYEHIRPNLKYFRTILDDNSDKYENLAYNYYDAQKVETDWMNSPGHRASIMRNNTKIMGIGVFSNKNGIYLIQNFTDGKLSKKCQSKAHMRVTVQISLNPQTPTKLLKREKVK